MVNTFTSPHSRHCVEENILYATTEHADPTLALPETVDNIYDPGLEDVHPMFTHIPVGDGCTRKSGRKW